MSSRPVFTGESPINSLVRSKDKILRARNLDECGHICRMRKYDMVFIFSFHMKCYSMIGFACVNFAFSYSGSLKLMAILLSHNFPSHCMIPFTMLSVMT